MQITGWGWVDPVIGAGIGLFLLPRAWKLGRDAIRILVQAAPRGIDLEAVTTALTGIDGVADVHDLHVWTLTSEMDVLTAHLGVNVGTNAQQVLQQARTLLADQFHIAHATLQVEATGNHECEEMSS